MTCVTGPVRTREDHLAVLRAHQLTAGQVANKLADVIEKAQEVYRTTGTNPPHSVEVGSFKVTLPDLRARITLDCDYCDTKIGAPGRITIVNLITQEEIALDDVMLHEIKVHATFRRTVLDVDAPDPDPVHFARVLTLL